MKPAVGAQFHGTWAELSDADRTRILDGLVKAGVTWVRIDVSWAQLEPTSRGVRDPYAVGLVDKVLKMAHDRGLHVVVTFWRAPGWATGNAASKNVPPKSDADYAAAIWWAAARWKVEVDAWEIWNEPNASEFFNPPDAVRYTKLLKSAYLAVKKGNPKALVVFGGPMFVDTDWIAKAYEAGARNSFDVMAVHPYQGNASKPPTDPGTGKRERLLHTDELVTLMAKNGDAGKPIWFTEFGWSTHANTSSTELWFLGVSEAKQAEYLKSTLDLVAARYPQVTNVFWYTSRDLVTGKVHQDNRGLFRRDFSAKPAVDAVRAFTSAPPAAPASKVVDVRAADWSRSGEAAP